MSNLETQLELISDLSVLLREKCIEHHFDGSTARVLQKGAKTMGDIDIVFPLSKIDEVKDLFIAKGLSPLTLEANIGLYHMSFYENSEKVHLLFYRTDKESFYNNHIQVEMNGKSIWVKDLKHFAN